MIFEFFSSVVNIMLIKLVKLIFQHNLKNIRYYHRTLKVVALQQIEKKTLFQ